MKAMTALTWISVVLACLSFAGLVIENIAKDLRFWRYSKEIFDSETGETISCREISKKEYRKAVRQKEKQ